VKTSLGWNFDYGACSPHRRNCCRLHCCKHDDQKLDDPLDFLAATPTQGVIFNLSENLLGKFGRLSHVKAHTIMLNDQCQHLRMNDVADHEANRARIKGNYDSDAVPYELFGQELVRNNEDPDRMSLSPAMYLLTYICCAICYYSSS
jgi:hypothetical protein